MTFQDPESVVRLLGPRDSFLKQVRQAFNVKVVARGQRLSLEGPPEEVAGCQGVLEAMQPLTQNVVAELVKNYRGRGSEGGSALLIKGFSGERIMRPKSEGQRRYVQAILKADIVFCIGPAGTGKTYLAVAVALHYLQEQMLKRIILSRPAVEAGEHLGFLPGDMYSKVNPYLRPLYDALHELMEAGQVRKYISRDLIEILPLAFVRGRTLDDAFVILDEAQNCTVGQMKTFLTRLGPTSKLVVTGDITQVDLPPDQQSGLVDVQSRLANIKGIRLVSLGTRDIVRHRLVRDIVNAYQQQVPPEASRTGKAEGNREDADDAQP